MSAWTFDPMHTQVDFSVKHLGMMTVRGSFTEVSGAGTIDAEHLENSTVELTIATDSISTHNSMRDTHLRSNGFLDIEAYPTITFTSSTIEPRGANEYTVNGALTIKGVSRDVAFTLVRAGEINDERMGHRVSYVADATIDRREFGMTFDAVADGKLVVGNDIKLHVEGELVEAAETGSAAA